MVVSAALVLAVLSMIVGVLSLVTVVIGHDLKEHRAGSTITLIFVGMTSLLISCLCLFALVIKSA